MILMAACLVVREEVGRVEVELKEVRTSLNTLLNLPDSSSLVPREEYTQLDIRQLIIIFNLLNKLRELLN